MGNKISGLSGLFILAVLLLVTLLFPLSARADISTASRFFGPVTVDGQNVLPGTEIIATVEGAANISWNASIFVSYGVSWYVLDVPPDNANTPEKDGGVNGDTVSFTLIITGSTITADTDTFQRTSFKYHPLATSILPLVVNTTYLPDGRLRTAYSKTLEVSGGYPPYNWNASGLPAGLILSSSGLISGTPTASGNFNVTVSVHDPLIRPMTPATILALRIWIPGDANGDGVVDIVDVTFTERIILEIFPSNLGADANLDSSINVSDITSIERIILGIFP